MGSRSGSSTLPPPPSRGWVRVDRTLRRVATGVLIVLAAAAVSGLLGVSTDRATDAGEDYVLSVDHASRTRPGLAVPFRLSIETVDGSASLPSAVTFVTSTDYLAALDRNSMEPSPSSVWNDGERARWTFEVPPGAHRFVVEVDARVEPGVQGRVRGRVSAEVDGKEVAAVPLTTWSLP